MAKKENKPVLIAKNNGTAHFQMTKFSIQDATNKTLKHVDMMKYVLSGRQVSIPLNGFNTSTVKGLKFVMVSDTSKKSVIYDIAEK